MAIGRPTSYDADVIAKARDYIDNFDEIQDEVVPTVVGLCRHIRRAKSTVYKWCQEGDKKVFSDIVKEIEESQEIKLVSGGLSNSMNANITKLMLTKHGYSDKQEIDHQSSDKSMSHPGYVIVDE